MGEHLTIGPPVHSDATQAADARANMAAITLERHGLDPRTATADRIPDAVKAELRDLARALGVDGTPERQPGHCVCGAVLTVTASGQQTGEYTRGRCLTCSRAAREADR